MTDKDAEMATLQATIDQQADTIAHLRRTIDDLKSTITRNDGKIAGLKMALEIVANSKPF